MTSKTGRMLSRLGTHRPITGAQSTQRIFSKATQNRNSTLQRTAELKLSGCHYEGKNSIFFLLFLSFNSFIQSDCAAINVAIHILLKFFETFITVSMAVNDNRNSQNAKMPNSNSSVLSSFKLIDVKMREDFFEDLLKNIGKYHLGKYCYNF
ncbi:hypothetical protein T05_16011 [Trichinella murrelli]|uniref:Uncharacterized protein n=1 Tax=Trichinella murrelli TaxID=144512 RepID=A0A0V0TS71_9BILA|nr:hypothetical protein T05_16011 [Trichinella murrelli]